MVYNIKHKKNYPWYQITFNPSNIAFSNFIASLVFHALDVYLNVYVWGLFVSIFLAIIAFEFVNSLITSTAIAFLEEFSVIDLTVSTTSLSLVIPTTSNLVVSSILIWSYLNDFHLIAIVSLFSFFLVAGIYQKEGKLIQTRKEIVNALIETVGARDDYTKRHSMRVSELATLVAKEMKLPYRVVMNVEFSGMLHDLGKINFPDKAFTQKHIDHETWERIIKHPEVSKDIMDQLSDFGEVAGLVELHHERYDGSGYPEKMKGEEIPIEARILAVVDSFDAMTSHRTYRRAFPVEFALKEIKDYSGIAYDPNVVDAFLKVIERVLREIEERLEKEELTYRFSLKRYQ
ncbi:MAG: HD domain-containing protein [Actinobacteria bacterium]|nr:HD domain-containing protein [Actinomycetota bacterium]